MKVGAGEPYHLLMGCPGQGAMATAARVIMATKSCCIDAKHILSAPGTEYHTPWLGENRKARTITIVIY